MIMVNNKGIDNANVYSIKIKKVTPQIIKNYVDKWKISHNVRQEIWLIQLTKKQCQNSKETKNKKKNLMSFHNKLWVKVLC